MEKGTRTDDISKGWCDAIKKIEFEKREPMWEQAIKHLISEDTMGPTMSLTLSQEHIQSIIVEGRHGHSIHEVLVEFGKWLMSPWGGGVKMYVMRFATGNEIWLAYLMATRYAKEWDGETWVNIGGE